MTAHPRSWRGSPFFPAALLVSIVSAMHSPMHHDGHGEGAGQHALDVAVAGDKGKEFPSKNEFSIDLTKKEKADASAKHEAAQVVAMLDTEKEAIADKFKMAQAKVIVDTKKQIALAAKANVTESTKVSVNNTKKTAVVVKSEGTKKSKVSVDTKKKTATVGKSKVAASKVSVGIKKKTAVTAKSKVTKSKASVDTVVKASANSSATSSSKVVKSKKKVAHPHPPAEHLSMQESLKWASGGGGFASLVLGLTYWLTLPKASSAKGSKDADCADGSWGPPPTPAVTTPQRGSFMTIMGSALMAAIPSILGSWCWPLLLVPFFGASSSLTSSSSKQGSHHFILGMDIVLFTGASLYIAQKSAQSRVGMSCIYKWGPLLCVVLGSLFVTFDTIRHVLLDHGGVIVEPKQLAMYADIHYNLSPIGLFCQRSTYAGLFLLFVGVSWLTKIFEPITRACFGSSEV